MNETTKKNMFLARSTWCPRGRMISYESRSIFWRLAVEQDCRVGLRPYWKSINPAATAIAQYRSRNSEILRAVRLVELANLPNSIKKNKINVERMCWIHCQANTLNRESHNDYVCTQCLYSTHTESGICSDALQFRSRILRAYHGHLFYFLVFLLWCVRVCVCLCSHWIWKERFLACKLYCCRSGCVAVVCAKCLAITHPFVCIRLSVVLSSSPSPVYLKHHSDNEIKANWGLTELLAEGAQLSSSSSRRSTRALCCVHTVECLLLNSICCVVHASHKYAHIPRKNDSFKWYFRKNDRDLLFVHFLKSFSLFCLFCIFLHPTTTTKCDYILFLCVSRILPFCTKMYVIFLFVALFYVLKCKTI